MKKIHKQILSLVLIVGVFGLFNYSIYEGITKRCISDYSDGLKAKSVELDAYLPFRDDSKIVKVDSEFKLEGDIPVMDGAAALYPICSAVVNATYPEESVEFDGNNFTVNSSLQMNNTRGAYKKIVDGGIDIAILAQPSKDQLAYAEEKGVELELVPIGREAFVFVVNGENPVDDLTTDQVRGIYNGEYSNWKELGGDDKLISALQRNEGSGSQTAMLSFMETDEIPKDYFNFLGSAIGFSFRFYVEGIVEEGDVKLLALDGAYPNEENIRTGKYPIVNNLYAVYRKGETNENVHKLVEWMLSEEGQMIIEETGYVSVN